MWCPPQGSAPCCPSSAGRGKPLPVPRLPYVHAGTNTGRLCSNPPATWNWCSNNLAAASTASLYPRTSCKGVGVQIKPKTQSKHLPCTLSSVQGGSWSGDHPRLTMQPLIPAQRWSWGHVLPPKVGHACSGCYPCQGVAALGVPVHSAGSRDVLYPGW